MYQPIHIDGRSIVVLRKAHLGYRVIESGVLSFDGETLTLGEGNAARVVSDAELGALMPVSSDSRINECRGFDFFVLESEEAQAGEAPRSVLIDKSDRPQVAEPGAAADGEGR